MRASSAELLVQVLFVGRLAGAPGILADGLEMPFQVLVPASKSLKGHVPQLVYVRPYQSTCRKAASRNECGDAAQFPCADSNIVSISQVQNRESTFTIPDVTVKKGRAHLAGEQEASRCFSPFFF